MTRLTAVLAASSAAALIAGCGSSGEQPTPTGMVRPDLPSRTTAEPVHKPKKRVSPKASRKRPVAPVPAFAGPIVRITMHNDLCTPDSAAAPAGETFQLRVRSTDHTYGMVFDSVHRFTVPAHGTGALRVAAGPADEPVLTNGGEPCAVVHVG